MSRSCALCGKPCRIEHHLTGRAMDEELVQDVCHDHHQLAHDDWNSQGVGAEKAPSNFLDRLHLRLTRLASFLGRLVALGIGGRLLLLLAAVLAKWAAGLHMRIMVLDARYPDWRSWPEMDEQDG